MKKKIMAAVMTAAMVAVSYTHLDVYKRQGRKRSKFLTVQFFLLTVCFPQQSIADIFHNKKNCCDTKDNKAAYSNCIAVFYIILLEKYSGDNKAKGYKAADKPGKI